MKTSALRSLFLATLAPLASPPSSNAEEANRLEAVTSWPGRDWETAEPRTVGMSADRLAEVATYAEQAGGGSGCVVRRGCIVKEWGDPKRLVDVKSATKGTLGATLLGLAVDDGLVKLDDPARKYYPEISAERPDDRLDEITIRQLATMTAGFDDERPPRLVYRPGTSGIYSNDGANMLAELLTIRFGDDLSSVIRRRVMGPLAIQPDEWSWRQNAYRPKTIREHISREFASGLTITHRALARIGLLYLHDGDWNGRRILSPEFVHIATTPTDLPAFVPYYAFFWGSNARGTFPDIPKDAFWALGLGDSIVVVCPSLDIVAVRMGTGSRDSMLPGGENKEDWGGRVAAFFKLVVQAVEQP
ncbi:serine hydrolase domain-containing protein [Paludisphaera rhizosphaerae]|uniref:serine hydrolase domain-containing protein n=1 Tax=Paludisphaera rhizosphaerae TaxID=2711216 RepID=UPI0013EACAF4|nr:serine hydrolase [Paludisphaera rhizosphaerae]